MLLLARADVFQNQCPQCGLKLSGINDEYCGRCGSPSLAAAMSFDPLRGHSFRRSKLEINRKAKAVVRLGVGAFGIGVAALGLFLFLHGWLLRSVGADFFELWACRIVGPVLAVQGIYYFLMPFRQGSVAKVLAFRPRCG